MFCLVVSEFSREFGDFGGYLVVLSKYRWEGEADLYPVLVVQERRFA